MSRVQFSAGARDVFHVQSVNASYGVHSDSYTMGTGAVSLGLKRQGREADCSSPSRTEVKNVGALFPVPICLNSVLLNHIIKYTDNFTFLIVVYLRKIKI
jgi:hypothetical protein